MKTVIIEDELRSREVLEYLIRDNCPDLELCGQADDVISGAALIDKAEPDIVFLDLQLKGGLGFDILSNVKYRDFFIIYTTAYDKYMSQALKTNVVAYLNKPIIIDELLEAVEKVKQIISTSERIDSKNLKSEIIAVPTMEGFRFLNSSEILKCCSQENYTQVFLNSGERITVSRTLKEFEEALSFPVFFRVHNSTIINTNFVTGYLKAGYIQLQGGSQVELSRRKKTQFLDLFTHLK